MSEKSPASVQSTLFPRLGVAEWLTFSILAGLIAAANIYTTLLIGWGDSGSIVAVLASVLLLGIMGKKTPSIYTLNLGQTMVSAGGSVGFAVASFSAVYVAEPGFNAPWYLLIPMFAAMGWFGTIVGTSVRRQMVNYYFPSGTACAVIQTAVTKELAPGERNRPVFMLKLWGSIASVIAFFNIVTFKKGGEALLRDIKIPTFLDKLPTFDIGVGPLYYGIGLVVGPRVGLGMLIGALITPLAIIGPLSSHSTLVAETGDWVKWAAIAILTIPTFVTIVFAYFYKTSQPVPPQFTPGKTTYIAPKSRSMLYAVIAVLSAPVVGFTAQMVFGLPWWVAVITMIIAWPLCIVNGRVTGETDINPVRLVAVVLLSGFFWMISGATAVMLLGMAVVGGTMASIAVDMMQDYRTGYLLDQDPGHQTSVQFVGSVVGAIVAIPTLVILIDQLGIGPDSSLPAPGATIWASMAEAMRGGFSPSTPLVIMMIAVSIVGSIYAWLTVNPATSKYMPSLFGIGIGMLVGLAASSAIFLGGLLRVIVTRAYSKGTHTPEEKSAATQNASTDTMLAGASIFAAAAIMNILLILAVVLMDKVGWEKFRFFMAGGH